MQSMLHPRLLLLLCPKSTLTCADVARQTIVAEREREREREREGWEGEAASQQRSPVHMQVFKASRCGHGTHAYPWLSPCCHCPYCVFHCFYVVQELGRQPTIAETAWIVKPPVSSVALCMRKTQKLQAMNAAFVWSWLLRLTALS